MIETYSFNVYRNAQAIVELREKHNVQILDTPKSSIRSLSGNEYRARPLCGEGPFFKEVLDSQRNFAKTVVPYWTKILDLYSELGIRHSRNRLYLRKPAPRLPSSFLENFA